MHVMLTCRMKIMLHSTVISRSPAAIRSEELYVPPAESVQGLRAHRLVVNAGDASRCVHSVIIFDDVAFYGHLRPLTIGLIIPQEGYGTEYLSGTTTGGPRWNPGCFFAIFTSAGCVSLRSIVLHFNRGSKDCRRRNRSNNHRRVS
jgi:hypothetical protein